MREMLIDRLKNIYKNEITSFYVPGHKHGRLIDEYLFGVRLEEIDFTEIDGTDNLHNAQDIIASAQEFASDFYGSDRSYFLVNGTTSGILSALSSLANRGDKILTTRDCHKSVYNAMTINDYACVYVDIDYDYEFDLSIGANYEDFREKLRNNKDVKAVVLTYPTYNGICYDLSKFIKLAHTYNIAVIIDEAHGAHLKMSKSLPKSSLDLGADIVIQSTHKMLPALTQSSMIHFKSKILDRELLESYLRIYQSSSPSYLLLASIDIAIDIAFSRGEELTNNYNKALKSFNKALDCDYYKNVNQIISNKHNLEVDPFKINIALTNKTINLNDLEKSLREEDSVQCEYSNRSVSLFVSSIATNEDDLIKLSRALDNFTSQIDNNTFDNAKSSVDLLKVDYSGEYKISLYEALKSKKQIIDLDDSIGKISFTMITPYPPGIPYILAGELITKSKLDMIKEFLSMNIEIEGIMQDGKKNTIYVILE